MKRLFVLLILFTVLVSLLSCGKKVEDTLAESETSRATDTNLTTESESEETETAYTDPVESDDLFTIETSFALLKYPSKWKEKVDVTVNDKRVTFSSESKPLFDLLIDSDEGFVMGTLVGESRDVVINVLDYPIENEEQAEMQEDMNVIMQNLMKDYNFIPGVKSEREETSSVSAP